ncbi:hypothetical protein BOX15_Mlig013584g1, partial [Macrostomum lignano]
IKLLLMSGNTSGSGGSSGGCSLSDYDVLCEIGTGSYGTCAKIRRKRDGLILVWKELSYVTMTEAEKRYLCSEVNLLKSLSHPNIVKYVDRIHDRATGKVYIIMEYCDGGDLLKRIRAHREKKKYIPEQQIWKWLTQLSLALRCCHCRQGVKAVLHRDLKPANCFLDSDGNLKLGDFGLARVLRHSGSFASTFVGTPYYMSPEQMQKSAYTEKSDIWSLGIVAYELACLRPPFVADKQRDLATRIRRGEFEPPPDCYSPALRALIADCLAVTPEHRPSVEDLLQRPEMIPYSGSGAEESISPERGSLQSWADSLAKRESAVRRASAQLESARLDLKARQRSLSELEARLAARERALIDVERKLANGQAQLRFEQLRLAESAAVQRLDAATSTEPTISNGRPTCDRCSSCQQLPQFTTPDTPPPESVALSAPSATSFSAVSVGLPPPVVALNGRQRRSGASSTPTNSRKVQPDEQQSAAVRRPPIPAPRRSVLRDQANQLYC